MESVWKCPECLGRLDIGDDRWRCVDCDQTYPAMRGVPDLRKSDDLYMSNQDDWNLAARLNADFDRLDFRGLLDRYFELEGDVPAHLRARQIDHILTAPGRVGRWVDQVGLRGPMLDLGCGSGSFLAAVGRSVEGVLGMDIAMRWLVVARKRLDEEGLGAIPLACACAEKLPIGSSEIATVIAGDVIEHVSDQHATLDEAHRVLNPGGRLFMASPNRYSLAPEPHVQIWGVGYLPRRMMPAYVRMRGGVEFRAIRTLGFLEWRKSLRRSHFGGGRIDVPPLPRDDLIGFGTLKRSIAWAYNQVVATRPGQWLARAIGPLFHVVCEKSARSASPAIRRRSRPSAVPK